MKTLLTLTMLSIITILFSCDNGTDKNTNQISEVKLEVTQSTQLSEAEIIINEAIKAHGGGLYDEANYSFVFREKEYSFQNNGADFIYTVKSIKEGVETFTVLKNEELTQKLNGEEVTLSEKDISKYKGALNSVIYFATLPHKLKDKAVIKKFIETTSIKGIEYDVIEITFDSEGGGKDHDDEFYYWINLDSKIIDYFAYNYRVNEGGVRFRSAYNSRVIDGIVFQDYVNHKAPVGTPLRELPALYEGQELKELSVIETEEVTNLKK